MSKIIIPGQLGTATNPEVVQSQVDEEMLAARMKALEDEMARINVMKASELIDWFAQDRIILWGMEKLPRVAILRDASATVSESGLILPGHVQKRNTGSIVALSPHVPRRGVLDYQDQDMLAKGFLAPGDRCTFTKFGESVHQQQFSNGMEVILDVVHMGDIFFVWRNDDIDAKDVRQEQRPMREV